MQSKSYLLNKENSLILRGLAIIAIMYHNLLHDGFFKLCQENEMDYSQKKADAFWGIIANPDWSVIFEISSFLGWIGVPIFVFLTGYGLAVKYPQQVHINKRSFIKKNYLKLFFLLFPPSLYFAYFDIRQEAWTDLVNRVIELSMLYNLDYPHLHVYPGVYWYFSLTFQFYILYCFCRKYLKPANLLIMSGLSLLLLYLLATSDLSVILSIYRYCIPGWFPLFAIGIWVANNDKLIRRIENFSKCKTIVLIIMLSILVVVMNFNVLSWLFVPIVSLFLFFLLSKIIINIKYVDGLFKWIGKLSAFIFVCHPIARTIVLNSKFHIKENGICFTLIVYTILALFLSYFYEKLYNQLSKRFIK